MRCAIDDRDSIRHWAIVLPLVVAGNVLVATLAWFFVSLLLPN
jgi:hypothetical protein